MTTDATDDRRQRGTNAPLGATPGPAGANFSVFSRHATGVELLLFDRDDDPRPSRVIRIDPADRTYHYWHVFVPGVKPGQLYGYRASGPSGPGMRFDPEKLLLDPYGRAVAVPATYSRHAAAEKGDNAPTAMKSVVVDTSVYDWEGDAPLRNPSARTIVYEMHVRGFTRHPSSGVAEKARGTFATSAQRVAGRRDVTGSLMFSRRESPSCGCASAPARPRSWPLLSSTGRQPPT